MFSASSSWWRCSPCSAPPGPAAHTGAETGAHPEAASPLGEFTPLTPARILDTRNGGAVGGVASGTSIPVQVTGRGGVPGSGVQAVVLNATVTNPTASSYLTIWPAGAARPSISNLNFVSGQTVANLVTVQVDPASGQVMAYNFQGTVDVIFDVVGFYAADTGPFGSRFHTVTPTRLLDTRETATPIGSESTRTLTVDGAGPIPASGVTAVALNVTITEPTAPSFLTAFPNDSTMPLASNVNYVPGLTVPNLVVVGVPTSGPQAGVIGLFNRLGSTHVVVDVVGYYDDDRSTEAGRFYAVTRRVWPTPAFTEHLSATRQDPWWGRLSHRQQRPERLDHGRTGVQRHRHGAPPRRAT